jgi:hypothetical protein
VVRSDSGTAASAGGQSGGDEAQRLVEDDRLQRGEPEQHDEQREPELRTAKADHAVEHSDGRAGGERHRQRRTGGAGGGRRCGHQRTLRARGGLVGIPPTFPQVAECDLRGFSADLRRLMAAQLHHDDYRLLRAGV